MQLAMDLGFRADIAHIRARLSNTYGHPAPIARRQPVAQLVRSLIGGRTKDAVADVAFGKLVEKYPRWHDVLAAGSEEVEATIRDVTFAERKAGQLLGTLRILSRTRSGFDLSFLSDWPLEQAMARLMRLPGVGVKVAAATLNFSTLDRAVFVADSHVLRVFGRYGIAAPDADAGPLQELVTGAMSDWTGDDLVELHRLVKRHGQSVCPKPRPRCGECPLATGCRYAGRLGGSRRSRLPGERAPVRPA